MNLAGLDQYLDLLISNEDVSNGKPDPEMYIKAINAFELNPKECLIIEDNENGIKAARASGGNLLVVKEVTDVTYSNIINRINELELEAD